MLCHSWSFLLDCNMGYNSLTSNPNRLDGYELVSQYRQITEVCMDDQHKYCKNPICECDCHE